MRTLAHLLLPRHPRWHDLKQTLSPRSLPAPSHYSPDALEHDGPNHDIADALGETFSDAVRELERLWQEDERYRRLSAENKRWKLRTLRGLREDGENLFKQQGTTATVVQQQQEDQIALLLHENTFGVGERLSDHIVTYGSFAGAPELADFIQEYLGGEWSLRFVERLKSDAGTKALRAFQLLAIRSAMEALGQMQSISAQTARSVAQAQQAVEQIRRQLEAMAERLRSGPDTSRLPCGTEALDAILGEMRAQTKRLDSAATRIEKVATQLAQTFQPTAASIVEPIRPPSSPPDMAMIQLNRFREQQEGGTLEAIGPRYETEWPHPFRCNMWKLPVFPLFATGKSTYDPTHIRSTPSPHSQP